MHHVIDYDPDVVRERSRPGAATDPPSGRGGSGLAAAFVIVAAILILSKVPTLAFERREAEENIYWRLAESLVRRMPLILKDIEGFSYQEISETLKCEMGTVKSRIFRGREKLKEILQPLEKELMN